MTIVKKIKKITLITLVGFSCFTGCSLPFEPELSTIEFELDARMEVDLNGYYHLTLDTTKWQTTHRISGHVYRDGESVNVLKFGWGSSHYWIVGDEFGYFVTNTGLTDNGTYVGYDTTFVDWFSGYEVPIVNGSSYSRMDGEVNTMIAPVKTMRGDTEFMNKLNDVLVEKIEEATNIAQDAPEIIKQEFDTLKESIIEEAERMEYEMSNQNNNQTSKTNQDSKITKALTEIEDINEGIERLNKILNQLI